MGAFTPFKRSANKFNYTPRYYDPAKEEREQRRAELFGFRRDNNQMDEEYIPGEYIRTQREARSARRGAQRGSGSSFRVWIMLGVVVALLIMGSALYNSIVSMMVDDGAKQSVERVEQIEEDVFNPEATIIIVPNDYVEE